MAQIKHNPATLRSSINDYYHYNPDTLMPLLMLALASQGKLYVGTECKKGYTTFASIDIDEVGSYEWVRLNPSLKKRLKEAKAVGATQIGVFGDIPNELGDIYNIFHEYDTVTVVQEYHHRQGILINHSSHVESDKAQRQYATICMAREFEAAPQGELQSTFLNHANILLELSGIQPKRPRIQVAEALSALIDYDGEGKVYNPFAGCAFAGAMIGAGEQLYADGDENNKLLSVARLLCYGTGQRGYDIKVRDSKQWVDGFNPDYVVSTYLGYVDGKSAFDFCLSHCLDSFVDRGKFAGIVSPKEIFENQSPLFKETVRRDWLDTIILLPFGEVAVLVNVCKPKGMKKRVRFLNMTYPWLSDRDVKDLLADDVACVSIKNSNALNKAFLKSLVFLPEEERSEYRRIRLGDYIKKIPKYTYDIERTNRQERILASIDSETRRLKKQRISSLFAPAYKMVSDCLITNSAGELEPRLFEHYGNTFFQDGYAFEILDRWEDYDEREEWINWLMHELHEDYVIRQLYPYGLNKMVPEHFSEDEVLNLTLFRRMDADEVAKMKSLPEGTVLSNGCYDYTIEKFLGHGAFGYTYKVLSHNKTSDERCNVVMKEFFPWGDSSRDELRAEIDEYEHDEDKNGFKEEADIMEKLGNTPDSHIAPAFGYFESEETETSYYLMPFYSKKSFDDLCKARYPFSEKMLINDVVIPLCKALHLAHNDNVLHLDIKPENIMLGDDGQAILIDFGVAKKYDKDGLLINRWGRMSCSEFSAPEMRIWQDSRNRIQVGRADRMVKFDPRADIYGLAASLYKMATTLKPIPIPDNSDEDIHIREKLDEWNYSELFANAIVEGLRFSSSARPKDAQAFLNLFPGCENIKL